MTDDATRDEDKTMSAGGTGYTADEDMDRKDTSHSDEDMPSRDADFSS